MDTRGGVVLADKPMQVVSLQEIVDNYDILSAEPTHLTVVPKGAREPSMEFAAGSLGINELGSSNTAYGAMRRQDYNPKMIGYLGYRIYDEMRRNDGQISMALLALKTPVLAARWFMQPFKSKDGTVTNKNQKIADFIWRNLTEWMTCSWPQFLTEALSFIDFGFYAFEKVFAVNQDGMIYWQKFAPRHPLDLQYWEYDDNGGPNSGTFYSDAANSQAVDIPIEKLLVFVMHRESGSLDGRSAMRPMYKHWYYKENLYKVDAIQKERHGIGIPIIKLPPGYKDPDKAAADQLGRNLRVNEKAHVTLPPLWEVEFAELKGQPVDCMKSIAHHDTQIARSIGLVTMTDTPGASVSDNDNMFQKGTRFIAEVMRDVINKWAIPELVGYNWGNVDGFPELKVRRIGDTVDYRQLSFAWRNLVGAGGLTPTEKDEAWFRAEMDLPDYDPDSKKNFPVNPQLGAQSTANNMNIGPGSNGRVGSDGQGAG